MNKYENYKKNTFLLSLNFQNGSLSKFQTATNYIHQAWSQRSLKTPRKSRFLGNASWVMLTWNDLGTSFPRCKYPAAFKSRVLPNRTVPII